jgi:hypothetical protein
MQASLALVHHANQYLITNGYDNREGLAAVLGTRGSGSGLTAVLALHRRFDIPLNLHVSGTLLEAIAWHHPEFLKLLRKLLQSGLIDLVGSSYGQNIMRFFSPDYNRKQLNEELRLYEVHLGVDPVSVHTFWPPERVWETRSMAPVLRDANLLNGGYRYVILDDRLLLSPRDRRLPRHVYDEGGHWDAELFRMHEIESGLGLAAFPIATNLRRSIPPRQEEDWSEVQAQLEGLLVHARENRDANLLAIYADDMEKVAGIGEWGSEGPKRYEAFLEWVAHNSWVRPVKLTEWATANEPAGRRKIETGTFGELANQFDAGEGYEKWFLAEDWAPYRLCFEWAESRVRELGAKGADPGLMELAEKQLLVGNWETAWHTPPTGPHGDASCNGHASPWARALTSHSRHAAVTAEAAYWMHHKDGRAHVYRLDIDNDGEEDVVMKNDHLFAVISAAHGGRVVAMFRISGERGAMVVGNPCDDWNWMEDLNKYMDVPRNHPGAFADVGFEHDSYEIDFIQVEGEGAIVRLRNVQEGSAANGLIKEFRLEEGSPELRVRYRLPEGLTSFDTEAGLSPDYLQLLRNGSAGIREVKGRGYRGWSSNGIAVWLKPTPGGRLRWKRPYQEEFGHGRMLRLGTSAAEFEIALVTLETPALEVKRARTSRTALEAIHQ